MNNFSVYVAIFLYRNLLKGTTLCVLRYKLTVNFVLA